MSNKNRPRVKVRVAPLDALVTSIVKPEDTSKESVRRCEDGKFCLNIPVKLIEEALERKRAQQKETAAATENKSQTRPRFTVPILQIAGPLEDLVRKKK